MPESQLSPTPVSLLDRLRDRADSASWDRFVELYTPLLFTWGRRLGHDEDGAADLVQDVFAVLVTELPAFRYNANRRFRGWLWVLFRNKSTDRQRADAARPAVPLADVEPVGPDELGEWAEAEYRRALVGRLIRLMRTEFEDHTWRACWLTAAEGQSVAEVAEALGMTPAAVYQARTRVLRRLREELAGLLD